MNTIFRLGKGPALPLIGVCAAFALITAVVLGMI
jgi:hypothetical protein